MGMTLFEYRVRTSLSRCVSGEHDGIQEYLRIYCTTRTASTKGQIETFVETNGPAETRSCASTLGDLRVGTWQGEHMARLCASFKLNPTAVGEVSAWRLQMTHPKDALIEMPTDCC